MDSDETSDGLAALQDEINDTPVEEIQEQDEFERLMALGADLRQQKKKPAAASKAPAKPRAERLKWYRQMQTFNPNVPHRNPFSKEALELRAKLVEWVDAFLLHASKLLVSSKPLSQTVKQWKMTVSIEFGMDNFCWHANILWEIQATDRVAIDYSKTYSLLAAISGSAKFHNDFKPEKGNKNGALEYITKGMFNVK